MNNPVLQILITGCEEGRDAPKYFVDYSYSKHRFITPIMWRTMRTLKQLKAGLYDPLKTQLNDQVFQSLLPAAFPDEEDVHFGARTIASLDTWCRALAKRVSNNEIHFDLESSVIRFLEDPNIEKVRLHSTKGLDLHLFGKMFDDHFGTKSSLIQDALLGMGSSADQKARCSQFPSLKTRPEAWGIKVRLLKLFWDYIRDDFLGYASAHYLDEMNQHVCLVEPCRWVHKQTPCSRKHATGKLRAMNPDMHLVVSRYIKPMTEPSDVGASLLVNAGVVAAQKGLSPDDYCLAKVFISHTWGENFMDFSNTLHKNLDPNAIVWVCSFALFQHGDIAASLSDIRACPFAVAMMSADRVVAVTDVTADAFRRCWVVFEADVARQLDKPYDISLPDNSDFIVWNQVGSQLACIDVRECAAARQEDKIEILQIAETGPGGIDGLNEKVRGISRAAMRRAELMGAVASNDLDMIQSTDVTDNELQEWRSIRGRSATHVAAARSCISVLIEILRRTNNVHLNMFDGDGQTPLSVAVLSGAVAAVPALIALRADIDAPLTGDISLLHCAAASGSKKMVSILLAAACEVDVAGDFEGVEGCTPLLVAAERGCPEIIYTLVDFKSDLSKPSRDGLLPLHMAAIKGRTEAAMALLSMGADVNCTDAKGRTPLMFAALFGRAALVSCLLGAGARTSQKCHRGNNVFYYVQKLGQEHDGLALTMTNLFTMASNREQASLIEIDDQVCEMSTDLGYLQW